MIPYYNFQNQNAYAQSLKNIIEQANGQLQQIQNQPIPVQQPTNLTQNFQLANTSGGNLKLVNSFDDVQKEVVISDTYFLSNENLWLKKANGDIRTFSIKEIKPKDEKDLIIERLQQEILILKGEGNECIESNGELLSKQPNANNVSELGETITTNGSANVSNVSTSKTTKRKS